jgi:hypothetical protein
MKIEEILYLSFLVVLFSFFFYPIFKEVKYETTVKRIIKELEEELKKEELAEQEILVNQKQKLVKLLYNTVLPFLSTSIGLNTYRFKYNRESYMITIYKKNDLYQIYFSIFDLGFNKNDTIKVSGYENGEENILIFFIEEDRIDLETYSHLKEVYDMYIDVIYTALILIYQRLYASQNYSCSYPIIKGKELNPNGIPVKQADRTTRQITRHDF